MEQTLSILLKKHYQLMDRYLEKHPLMKQIEGNVEQKKAMELLLWLDIQLVIGGIEPTFFKKLKKKAPDLSEKEKQLCCLLRLHVPIESIAVLLQLGKTSISVYKSEIVKNRFKLQGISLNLLLQLL